MAYLDYSVFILGLCFLEVVAVVVDATILISEWLWGSLLLKCGEKYSWDLLVRAIFPLAHFRHG